MFKVTKYKVRAAGTIYGPKEKAGDIIKDLPEDVEKKLEDQGYGFILEAAAASNEGQDELIPDDYTVDDAKGLIEKTNDKEALYSLLDYEEAHKNRSGVIKPLEEKIVEIEEAEEEKGEPANNINVNLNPDDVVKD